MGESGSVEWREGVCSRGGWDHPELWTRGQRWVPGYVLVRGPFPTASHRNLGRLQPCSRFSALLQVLRMACVLHWDPRSQGPHWTRASAAWVVVVGGRSGLCPEQHFKGWGAWTSGGEPAMVLGLCVCVCQDFSGCYTHLKLIRELWLVFGKPTRIPRAPLLDYECHRWVLGNF